MPVCSRKMLINALGEMRLLQSQFAPCSFLEGPRADLSAKDAEAILWTYVFVERVDERDLNLLGAAAIVAGVCTATAREVCRMQFTMPCRWLNFIAIYANAQWGKRTVALAQQRLGGSASPLGIFIGELAQEMIAVYQRYKPLACLKGLFDHQSLMCYSEDHKPENFTEETQTFTLDDFLCHCFRKIDQSIHIEIKYVDYCRTAELYFIGWAEILAFGEQFVTVGCEVIRAYYEEYVKKISPPSFSGKMCDNGPKTGGGDAMHCFKPIPVAAAIWSYLRSANAGRLTPKLPEEAVVLTFGRYSLAEIRDQLGLFLVWWDGLPVERRECWVRTIHEEYRYSRADYLAKKRGKTFVNRETGQIMMWDTRRRAVKKYKKVVNVSEMQWRVWQQALLQRSSQFMEEFIKHNERI